MVKEPRRASRVQVMCLMASMSVAAGEIKAAESYLLELMAWCAFDEHLRGDPRA